MRKTAVVIAVHFVLMNFCSGQDFNNGDFFELGVKSGKFIESSFLVNSRYQSELSDPAIEDVGLLPSSTGKNYSAKLRYGKKIFTNAHLVGEFGFSRLNEQVLCFCHFCDKIAGPFTLVSLNAIHAGIGGRYRVVQIKRFSLSLEAIGSYSLLTNESDVKYFGYSIHPMAEYRISEKLRVNLKYGYEQSFNDYEKRVKYVELAFNYWMKEQ